MLTIEKLNERILKASPKQLRLILKDVFNETFDYPEQNLQGAVFGSIHMNENTGDEDIIISTYLKIWNILETKYIRKYEADKFTARRNRSKYKKEIFKNKMKNKRKPRALRITMNSNKRQEEYFKYN